MSAVSHHPSCPPHRAEAISLGRELRGWALPDAEPADAADPQDVEFAPPAPS